MDGRTPDHEYPISSPMSLRLRWAKKYSNSNYNLFARKLASWFLVRDKVACLFSVDIETRGIT